MASNPFAAPPPQTMAQPTVQLPYDDDDILMDYDDEPQGPGPDPLPLAPRNESSNSGTEEQMMEVEQQQLAPEKIYLRGVDNMSTGNVKAYVAEHFTGAALARVEWIDDSSCNLVYHTATDAHLALTALTSSSSTAAPLTLRPAHPAASHPASHLELRTATLSDVKIKGARDRSRYYLFHPEEDRLEQLERQRREGHQNPRRPARRRSADSQDRDRDSHRDRGRDRDYERRYYDSREHSRRRNGASAEVYTDTFYDDTRERTLSPIRRRSRTRTRSRSPSRSRSRSRSRSPIELFPSRRGGQPVELFPSRERAAVELFPAKASGPRFRSDAPLETATASVTAAATGAGMVELFPEKIGAGGGGVRRPMRAALEERITMPGRSLEERINIDGDGGGGFKIKGRGGGGGGGGIGGDDLFAEKLRAVKGEGLVVDRAGGRRGQRRNRAEDMFG